MFKDPLHWFPNPYFSTILAILLFGTFFIDYALPKGMARRDSNHPILMQDRGSFRIIQGVAIISLAAAVFFRSLSWALIPGASQYAGLLFIVVGLLMREWAIVKLGQFFSRTVQIKSEHQLITDGPYRWLRHPAYTGMIFIYLGIALAIGTWLGAVITTGLMLAAILYRIRVEEQVLIEKFGDEYRDYMKRTWGLLPRW
jgi:protein-S-isoprenylcysteine O-methyltransferase Ste14